MRIRVNRQVNLLLESQYDAKTKRHDSLAFLLSSSKLIEGNQPSFTSITSTLGASESQGYGRLDDHAEAGRHYPHHIAN
jgi:hypothetical protein